MATLAPDVAGTAIDEYDAISAVAKLYMDGSASNDGSKLQAAFHPDARMFGAISGHRLDMPIQEFFKLAASMPMGPAYRARITSVNQVGDAATAVVAEDGCWGTVSFIDFFSLAKVDGSWKIVTQDVRPHGRDAAGIVSFVRRLSEGHPSRSL